MNSKEVDRAIYDGLAGILVQAGFKGRRSDCRFIRPTAFGFQDVGALLWNYDPTFAFSVNMGLRFDAIQAEANRLYPLDLKYWADAFTILLKPEKARDHRHRRRSALRATGLLGDCRPLS